MCDKTMYRPVTNRYIATEYQLQDLRIAALGIACHLEGAAERLGRIIDEILEVKAV